MKTKQLDEVDEKDEGDRVAFLSDVEAAKNEVLDVLGPEGSVGKELAALGLDAEEIKDILGAPAVYNAAGELVTEATGLFKEIGGAATPQDIVNAVGIPDDPDTEEDEASGIYKELRDAGLSETALGEVGDVVKTSLLPITNRINALSVAVGLPARADNPDTEEDESRPATGLYAAIDKGGAALNEFIGTAPTKDKDGNLVGGSGLLLTLAEQDVAIADLPAAVEQIVGAPANGNIPATGIYKELGALGITVGDIEDAIGKKDDGTGLYGYISSIRDDIVQNYIGSPAKDGTDATGVYLAIEQGNQAVIDLIGVPPAGTPEDVVALFNNLPSMQHWGVTLVYDPETNEFVRDNIGFKFTGDNQFTRHTPEEILGILGLDTTFLSGTGLFATLAEQGVSIADLPAAVENLIGVPPEYDDAGKLVEGTGTQLYGEFLSLGYDVNALANTVGVPPKYDDAGELVEGTGTGLYGYISGIRDDIVQNYIGSPADGDTPATGIYLAIDQGGTALNEFIGTAPTVDEDGNLTGGSGLLLRLAQQDVAIEDLPAAVEQIVGAPADGDTPATGIYKELGDLGITVGDIEDAIGNKDEGTGLYGYISGIRDDIVQNYIGSPADGDTPATGIYLAIDQGGTALNEFIGTAPTVDEDGNLTGGSGLLLRLAQQDVAIEDLPAAVEQIVGAPADGDTPATGIYKELGDLGITVGDIEDAIGNKDEGTGLYGYISGIRDDIVQNYIGEPKYGVDPNTGEPTIVGGTGLYGVMFGIDAGNDAALEAFIGTAPTVDEDGNLTGGSGLLLRLAQQDVAIEDLPAAVEQIVGAPTTNENGEVIGGTGLYGDMYNLGIDVGRIEGLIGNPEDGNGLYGVIGTPAAGDIPGTGLYGYIDAAVTGLATTEDVERIVGVPDIDEETGELTDKSTGLYLDFYNAGVDYDTVINLIGVPDNPETEDVNEGRGLFGYVGESNEDVKTYIDTLLGDVPGQVTEIAGFIGKPATVDEDGNVIPATGLHKIIENYAGDSKLRDGAITDAINKFTSDGQYTIEQVLTAIDTSNTDIKNFIGSPGADVDDPNTPEDETLPTGIYEGIAISEGRIIDAVSESEDNTNEYLTYISQIIGVPATELTQEDIDTVVGLIGEDEAITEINNDNRLYDVNFDGVINDIDIGILQGYVDIGVEGVGEIPASGLYGDAARRQFETQGFISDQDDITRGLISSEEELTRGLVGQTALFNAMMGAGDITGRRVDVTTPDPARINYMYDFEDIFATPQQKGLFPSPYGGPQRAQQQQIAQKRGIMSGPLQIGGMAQGGKVDYDFTDEIMQIMSYGDNQ
jgi:hypothetical protein